MRTRIAFSVDPGSTGAGVACWDMDTWEQLCGPLWVVNLMPSSPPAGLPPGARWQHKLYHVAASFRHLVQEKHPVACHMELPEFFDDAAGRMSAVEGSYTKLILSCGMLTEICRVEGVALYTYEVREWKGQLPKEVIERRIRELLPGELERVGAKSHAIDAIGIGLHAKGRLHAKEVRGVRDRVARGKVRPAGGAHH